MFPKYMEDQVLNKIKCKVFVRFSFALSARDDARLMDLRERLADFPKLPSNTMILRFNWTHTPKKKKRYIMQVR